MTARFSVATPSDEELWRSRDDAQPLKRLNVLEGAVDDPLLANPRQRHERLGTGWYGVIFEFEGVLVPSAHEDHMQAWREVCSTYGKSPPFFLLERAEGMKTEQVRCCLARCAVRGPFPHAVSKNQTECRSFLRCCTSPATPRWCAR